MWRIILILSILLTSITAAGAANDDPFPAVASSYLLAIDGETVWAHRPERRLAPASLTKIIPATAGKMPQPCWTGHLCGKERRLSRTAALLNYGESETMKR